MKITLKNRNTENGVVHIFAKSVDFNTKGVDMILNDEKDVEILEDAGYEPCENTDRQFMLMMSFGKFLDVINVIQNS